MGIGAAAVKQGVAIMRSKDAARASEGLAIVVVVLFIAQAVGFALSVRSAMADRQADERPEPTLVALTGGR
jgi:hypothetical protein